MGSHIQFPVTPIRSKMAWCGVAAQRKEGRKEKGKEEEEKKKGLIIGHTPRRSR